MSRRKAARLAVALTILLGGAVACEDDDSYVHVLSTGDPVVVESTTTAAPPPRPDHCVDYDNLEAGRGHPENQHWFNYLTARDYARLRGACRYGVGTAEWYCLEQMIQEESSWYELADGAGSTWGIPQAYPGHKMATHGLDWRTNGRVQVRWMLDYIEARYGSAFNTWRPCHAGY